MTIPLTEPLSTDESKSYYIVAVRLKPDPLDRGRFSRRSYDWAWLAIDSGYSSHSSEVRNAHRFASAPTQEHIDSFSGMPWYYIHDRRFKPKVYRVDERAIKEFSIVT